MMKMTVMIVKIGYSYLKLNISKLFGWNSLAE